MDSGAMYEVKRLFSPYNSFKMAITVWLLLCLVVPAVDNIYDMKNEREIQFLVTLNHIKYFSVTFLAILFSKA